MARHTYRLGAGRVIVQDGVPAVWLKIEVTPALRNFAIPPAEADALAGDAIRGLRLLEWMRATSEEFPHFRPSILDEIEELDVYGEKEPD